MGHMGCHAAPARPSLAAPVIAVTGGLASVPAAVLAAGLAAAALALAAIFLAALLTGGAVLLRARLRYLLWAGMAAPFGMTALDDIVPYRPDGWLLGGTAGLAVACMGLWLTDHQGRKMREQREKLEAQQQWQDSGGRMQPVVEGDAGAGSNSLPARMDRAEEQLGEQGEQLAALREQVGFIVTTFADVLTGAGIATPDLDATQPMLRLGDSIRVLGDSA